MFKYRFIVHIDKQTNENCFIASQVYFNEDGTPRGYNDLKIITQSYKETIFMLSDIQEAIHKEMYYAAPDFPKIYESNMPPSLKYLKDYERKTKN